MNRVLDSARHTGGAPVLQQLRQADGSGAPGTVMNYLALHVDHIVLECAHRPPRTGRGVPDLEPKIGFGLERGRHQGHRDRIADQIARAIERAEGMLGTPGRVKLHLKSCGFYNNT